MDQFGVLVESIGFKSQSRSTSLSKLKSQPNQTPPPNQNTNDDVFPAQFANTKTPGGGSGIDLDAFFVGTSSSGFNNDDDDIFGFNNNRNTNFRNNAHSSDDLLFGFHSNTTPNIMGGYTATAHSRQSSGPSFMDSSFGEDPFSIFESSSSRVEKSSSKNSSTIDELEAFAMGSSQNNGNELGGKISNEDITRVQEKLSNMRNLGQKGNAASDGNIKVSLPKKDRRESNVTPGSLHGNPMEKVSVRGQKNEAKSTYGNEDPFGEWFSNNTQTNSSRGPKSEIKDDVLDSLFGGRNQNNVKSTSSPPPRVTKKPPSNTNHVDDFLFFGEPSPSAVEFHEIEGEPEERRRARFNQHMRTKERMAKALSEKNQRDLQAQHEQEERLRSAESTDSSIKRWAAGKEGNLRALLSSLQDVLWPECGWQRVSLTDMITSVSVKKVYHKATLCVHPDKVQQKGATAQQKYIAEKVFDILKESWNKFNAEELR